ncbi:uncharacterized protein [Triticum aestivum]|uniref:uncharacterized protein isoform X2 n=1 Tax=Triticum aestivum TaxID=4565 RepID=UPI001D016331|nr:uncharacterized protein LOC123110298 isoform X2 [Triticum aestivum]
MDDANKPQRPQQEEEQKPMSEDKTTMMKVLSEDGGGEAEPSWESGDGDAADHNHRGWKAMPYVIVLEMQGGRDVHGLDCKD